MAQTQKKSRKNKKIDQALKSFEKVFLAADPDSSQISRWNETKTQIESGIDEIIATADSPYISKKVTLPLILIATPEIVYLPRNMGSLANVITTGDGGGLADISAALVGELDRQGLNVHVTLPEYQTLFKELSHITKSEYEAIRNQVKDTTRIHPIVDDIFKVATRVYDDRKSGVDQVNLRRATAFMRGVNSRLLPRLKAQNRHLLVHCNDWMTGLIPPAAKSMRIRSLMTFHNVFTTHQKPSGLRKHSIDIKPFWKHLILDDKAAPDYKTYRRIVKLDPYVDFMNSGLYAADAINTVSPTFLKEMVEGYFEEHDIMSETMRDIVISRNKEKCARGILNAPASAADPRRDPYLVQKYWFEKVEKCEVNDVAHGKMKNRRQLQKELGLHESGYGPIFFWPSRIARPQKGFELLLSILPHAVGSYYHDNLQIAVIANGEQELVEQIKQYERDFPGRVSYRPFDRRLSQLGIAGSDFVLMPSLYEPCGTPQVVGQLYGTPPVVRKTGGLADTVKHLSYNGIDGSGFVFEEYNEDGLLFGMDQAIKFYRREKSFKVHVLERIMKECVQKFNIKNTAKQYIEMYEEVFNKSGRKIPVK